MEDKMKRIFNEKTKIYWIYAILFFILSAVIFSIFIINKRSFIWQTDGIKQHYIILKDFNEMIRNFITGKSEGLTLFSWNMGLGLDVIGQYSYYVLGDPFAYISLLFPMQYLEYAYTFLIVLRMFCIGLAFIIYARYHNKEKGNYNILIGAIIYTFSSFTLFAGVRHPYFLNAMILLPLLLLGIDKLLRENKKTPFMIFVTLSAIANYYFFYMNTIIIFIYAIISYLCEYRKEGIKHFFRKLGSAVICYIVGILIASIVLLPTIYTFLNSARSGEETICQYSSKYYWDLFSKNLVSAYGDNWSFIGVASIILLMLPILWLRRKEHKVYFIYFIIATIMLLIPFLGSVMNGFSYPNNRWSFAYAFILAYIITLCFDTKYNHRELKYMGVFLTIYSIFMLTLAFKNQFKSSFIICMIQVGIAILMLISIWYQNKKGITFLNKIKIDKLKIVILILVASNISVMAYGLYSSYDKGYAKQFIRYGKIEEEINTQLGDNEDYSQNIQKILQEDKSFYRIAKNPHQMQNLSIYHKYPSTEVYLSLGNKYVYQLSKELEDNRYTVTMNVRGFEDRTKITTLLGTKYYVADEKHQNHIPYGYSLKEDIQGVKTYQNNLLLSIGVSYDQYMLREDYEKLNPIEKEDALLKTAVIEKEEDIQNKKLQRKTNLQDIHQSYKEVPYRVVDEENIRQGNKIITQKKNRSILLDIDQIQNSELYVYISDFAFQGNEKHSINAKFQSKSVGKTIEDKINSAYYQKSPEILLNLGYYKQAKGQIELKFSAKGTYEFEKIQVIAVPMDNYENTIRKLQQNQLEELTYNNKEIKGKLDLSQDAILQIASSYTDGWKAYVDGEKVDTIRVNTAFIGIPVSAGEHEIYLEYEVPYLKVGIAFTGVGIVVFMIVVILEKRRVAK